MIEKYSLTHYMNKEERSEYHRAQRVERKLLLLKRATLLSYISIVCRQELAASLHFETKDRLIDFLVCNGHAEDCVSAYQVKY